MVLYSGIVQEGSKWARELGYPTVNICYSGDETGVYVAQVLHDGLTFRAAAFADPERGVLEAHIIDHSADLYGEMISIELLEKLRDTKQFGTDAELKKAIDADVERVRSIRR